MRVLAITPWVPSKRRPRSLGLLTALAEKHEVFLVASCWDPEDWDDLASLPFETEGVAMSRLSAARRAGVALVSRRPMQQAYLDSHRMRKAIQSVEERFEPDVAYFNTLRSAQWRRSVNARRIIDLDEFRSEYYEQVGRQHPNWVWRRVARLEARRMKVEERRIVEDFERVLVSSPTDLAGGPVRLVRSPDALDLRNYPGRATRTQNVVFVGRMSYAANVSAITWFAQNVWPEVSAHFPEAKLDIVGDAPTAQVRALASDSVRVHGRVDDVLPFYQRARATIIPVTAATGVQMKLIEALRLGIPTVATPLVARQAGVVDGVHLLCAQTTDEWREATITLMTDDKRGQTLASAGRAWASRHYSPTAIREALLAEFEQLGPSASSTSSL